MLNRAGAIANVKAMRAETPRNAAIRLIELALRIGNLTEDALAVYQAELEHLKGN